MSRLTVLNTPLPDLFVIERKPIADNRGFFERLFCVSEFEKILAGRVIRQINHTVTIGMGIVRGMHFQNPPHCEQKIVSCIKGEVYDVAIDLRKGSPTFLKYFGTRLSSDNFRSLYIPEGFAHGFQNLSSECELIYLHTADYHPKSESGINIRDPLINIEWPLEITDLSPRDLNHSFLSNTYLGVETSEMPQL